MANCFDLSKVNGGWGNWNAWESCPVTCGGANQTRTRNCDDPTKMHGGDDCTIDGTTSSETQKCNEAPCPGKKTKKK